MSLKIHNPDSVLKPWAGWVALLLYVGMCSPLGIGLVTVLGKLDLDHRMELQAVAGEVRVVLQHQFDGMAHHHGLLAQTLTFFSTSSQSTQSDHVLPFQAADGFSTVAQSKPVPEVGEKLPIQTIAASKTSAICGSLKQTAAYHPPPSESGARLCLRSTVLLI